MASSEPEVVKVEAPAEPEQSTQAQPEAAVEIELTPIQAAFYGLAQQMMTLSRSVGEEAKACGVMARKGPDAVLRELPRHVASALALIARMMERSADIAAATGDVEARVVMLEMEEDLHGIVGSIDSLEAFLDDVLALCVAFEPFAISDEHKELLGVVRGDADDMLARIHGEEPEGDEEPGEPVEVEAETPVAKEGADAS